MLAVHGSWAKQISLDLRREMLLTFTKISEQQTVCSFDLYLFLARWPFFVLLAGRGKFLFPPSNEKDLPRGLWGSISVDWLLYFMLNKPYDSDIPSSIL